MILPALTASLLIVCARAALSTLWIMTALSMRYLTLLRCRWPIMCHWISDGSCGNLSLISWTLFSPKLL